ncbi:DUF4232 domain-containing protein [Streptomyces sp. NPDC048297]|uniref:DUF4232 domain-containing protein n=1 Tax=Streptomyces sp. NPDC048297 TaxID=3365531 RepID=UPI0037238688
MLVRAALAVPVVCAAALLVTAPQSQASSVRAAPARCAEKVLAVDARAVPADPSVIRFGVTNQGTRACVVDRVPTITFGGLDGAALPVPDAGSGTYRLGAGVTAYAAVRTIVDPADPETRRTGTLTVAASASHWGRTFTAARLGTGRDIRVWEPVTTWWQPTAARADRAIGLG